MTAPNFQPAYVVRVVFTDMEHACDFKRHIQKAQERAQLTGANGLPPLAASILSGDITKIENIELITVEKL